MKKQTKIPKRKKGAWFVPIRGSYLPASWQGWLTYIPYSAYLIFALVAGWQQMNSKALAVLFILPNWLAATAVMTWLAKRKS